MNAEEIRAQISASQELKDLIPDVAAIKAELESANVEVKPYEGGFGTVLSVLGKTEGPQVLDTLDSARETDPLLKWGWRLLERGELDFGDPITREMLDDLVTQEVLSAAGRDKLKQMAERPVRVSIALVKRAIWSDTGELLV